MNNKYTVSLDQLLESIEHANSIDIVLTNADICITLQDIAPTEIDYVPARHWLCVIADKFDGTIPVADQITCTPTKDIDDSDLYLYHMSFDATNISINVR